MLQALCQPVEGPAGHAPCSILAPLTRAGCMAAMSLAVASMRSTQSEVDRCSPAARRRKRRRKFQRLGAVRPTAGKGKPAVGASSLNPAPLVFMPAQRANLPHQPPITACGAAPSSCFTCDMTLTMPAGGRLQVVQPQPCIACSLTSQAPSASNCQTVTTPASAAGLQPPGAPACEQAESTTAPRPLTRTAT